MMMMMMISVFTTFSATKKRCVQNDVFTINAENIQNHDENRIFSNFYINSNTHFAFDFVEFDSFLFFFSLQCKILSLIMELENIFSQT
jgi:hypothetical protein